MRRIVLALGLGAALVVGAGRARMLGAQVDVIRGRVTSTVGGGEPVANVSVTATSLNGNVNRNAKTDKDGRYTITFPEAEGDYFVTFVVIGFAPRRIEVKRTADQDILLGDARLTPIGAVLDTVVTTGDRNRNRPVRGATTPDISGTEKSIMSGLVPPDQVGELAAMAATLPGVLYIQGVNGDPSGISVLGLDQDQNATSLNGLNSGATDIPRDANVSVNLATSPYDVSQGQFSGGRINIRTMPGSNYITRASSVLFNAPQLEWTDATGRALGQQYTNANVGGSVSGPFALDKAFYSIAYQFGRRGNDLHTLLNTDSLGLEADGIAADSVNRLIDILSGAQVPATVRGFPNDRLNDQGLILGSLDLTPPSSTSGQAYNLTFQGAWNRSSPASALTTVLPAASFDATSWNGAVQAHHSGFFGFGVLSESAIGYSAAHRYLTPYLGLPSGNVVVNSAFADGTSGVQSIGFGGTSASTSTTNNSIDLTNQLSWFSANNKHRVKLTSELRRDGYSIDQANNELGTFAFNSLSDLAANQPASYTRELTPISSSGGEWIAGLSLGDSYRRTPDLQIVYGARVDANRYERRPVLNSEVADFFDLRNDQVPNGLYVSPRVGFSWTYGTAPQIGAFDGAARLPRAVVRGGVGIFQNSLSASLPSQAMVNSGVFGGQQQITCVGSATPTPDWREYASDPGSVPNACADGTLGSGPFASTSPNVTLFAPNYASQRSLRSTLQWAGAVLDNRAMATVTATYSRNMNQPGFVDLNVDPATRFALPDEGGRPVFVDPGSIVPATGAIAPADGHETEVFNRVTELRSNLTSTSKQLTISLSPASVNSQYTWGLSYTLNNVRDNTSGFTSTVGNPFDESGGRSSADWRHQIIVNVGSNMFDLVRLNWVQRFMSGMPFTPMVATDVNGDGYANDRAFIVDPTHASPANATLGADMATLLGSSSSSVRDCLERQLNQLADRNSCEGPWTSTAFMTIAFNPVRIRLPQRATLSFVVGNPLGAADYLLHGENHTHGWGQAAFPDPRLLFVRGFDPQTLSYTYEVNQRFGNTSQVASAIRNPVTLTASLRVDIGPSRERQALTQTLDRGRTSGGAKVSETTLRLAYGSAGIVNPMDAILRDAAALGLTPTQADSVATMNRRYVIQLDSIWTPVARYYASLPEAYDQSDAYQRYRRAREASVDVLIGIVPSVKALLTPDQRRKLPDLITAYLDLRYLAAVRSGTSGTPGGVFAPGSGTNGGGTPLGGRSGG
jgi:Carboxypeptidase regulatory-like domain